MLRAAQLWCLEAIWLDVKGMVRFGVHHSSYYVYKSINYLSLRIVYDEQFFLVL